MHHLLLWLDVMITQWRAALGVAEGAFIIALICTMPIMFPKTGQEWYTWIREALQTAIPAARAHREQLTQKEDSVKVDDSTVSTKESSTAKTNL
jgi:hypothetical protein